MVAARTLQKGGWRSRGFTGHMRPAVKEVEPKREPAGLAPVEPEQEETRNGTLDERVAEMHFAAVSIEEAVLYTRGPDL